MGDGENEPISEYLDFAKAYEHIEIKDKI